MGTKPTDGFQLCAQAIIFVLIEIVRRNEYGMDREGLSTMPSSVTLWLLFISSHSLDLEDR